MNFNRTILSIICILTLLSSCVGGASNQSGTEREQQETSESKDIPGVEKVLLGSVESIIAEEPLSAKYDSITIGEIQISDQLQKNYPYAVNECRTKVVEQLKSKNTYKLVADKTNSNSLGKQALIEMKVLDMRIASGSARFWGGAFAGNSFMDILVEIQDVDSKEIVHKKILSTTNNAFAAAWSFGANDRSLPTDFGILIGEYIYKHIPASD